MARLLLLCIFASLLIFTSLIVNTHPTTTSPAIPISQNPMLLKERIAKAKNGDYIVTETQQMTTLLAIRSIQAHSLIIEEISAPTQSLKKMSLSWPEWIQAKAPGHTSWSMIEIDLDRAEIIECYSFSRSCWLELNSTESLFTSLLTIPLKALSKDQLLRIGPPPIHGEVDRRKIWTPPVCFEGKKQTQLEFDVYQADWPQDKTNLAGKSVSLYFDRELHFPFPFWVQIDASLGSIGIKAIDAGRKLPSLFRSLPRRAPQFIGQPCKTEVGLQLKVKSPKYYHQFDLFAIDVTGAHKEIYPVSYSMTGKDNEYFFLEIEQSHLLHYLEPHHKYTWLLVPTGHAEYYAETSKPFVWTPDIP